MAADPGSKSASDDRQQAAEHLARGHALAKENRRQHHYDGRRGVEKGGGGRYFGDFDGGSVAGCKKEQAQQSVGNKKRHVGGTHPERGAVSGADQDTYRNAGGEHAQKDKRVAGQPHGAEHGDEGAVQAPQNRAGDDHGRRDHIVIG